MYRLSCYFSLFTNTVDGHEYITSYSSEYHPTGMPCNLVNVSKSLSQEPVMILDPLQLHNRLFAVGCGIGELANANGLVRDVAVGQEDR